MGKVLENVTATFGQAFNSNNTSSNSAIFTSYRKHRFAITLPTEFLQRYNGDDIENATFKFTQVAKCTYGVTVNTYWVFYNSTSCPFATGTTETVSVSSGAYPTSAASQCKTQLACSTSVADKAFSVNVTPIIQYAFDNVTPADTETTSFYIWNRFGVSSPKASNGPSPNIGNWSLTITTKTGLVFLYQDGEWKQVEVNCYNEGTWETVGIQLCKDDTWQDI